MPDDTAHALVPAATGESAVAIRSRLDRHAHAARGAYADNTTRAICNDTAVWTAWCIETGHASLPAAPATVADFVDAMAETRAPATIRRYVSSVAHLHRAAGVANPCASDDVKFALKRMHREKGRRQEQAHGLTLELRNRMIDHAPDTLLGKRDKALLAVAYDTLLRTAELIDLDVAALSPVADDGSAAVLVRRSKSDQEGAGAMAYLAPDTVVLVQTWLSASGIDAGELFRAVPNGIRAGDRLHPGDVSRRFKAMARAANIAPELVDKISGHSSRVGAAQDMSNAGLELGQIMQAGRWKTAEMVGRYTEGMAVRRGGAAKLAAIQNRA